MVYLHDGSTQALLRRWQTGPNSDALLRCAKLMEDSRATTFCNESRSGNSVAIFYPQFTKVNVRQLLFVFAVFGMPALGDIPNVLLGIPALALVVRASAAI